MLLLIPLLVTAFSWKSGIQATPILSNGPAIRATLAPNLYSRNELQNLNATFLPSTPASHTAPFCTCSHLRTTWDILWSCVATIFACTWVAVHPNSPGVNPGRWKPTLRRLELMMWSLLTPEMIIFWAMRQWFGAREIAREYKDLGWTMTHGHFLQMGGFVLSSNGNILEVLTAEYFEELRNSGGLKFPAVSAEEITALSKGDGLSKTIVLCQTLWFISQCISRAVQGLVITKLELATCAFRFLNAFMYFLWWDKPLDATCVIRLEIIGQDKRIPMPPARLVYEAMVQSESEPLTASVNHQNEEVAIILDNVYYIQQPPKAHIPHSKSEHLSLPLWNDRATESPNYQSAAQSEIPTSTSSTKANFHDFALFIWRRLWKMRAPYYGADRHKMQAGIFGALDPAHKWRSYRFICYNLIIIFIAIMFGGIHCAGWRFEFPSHAEKIIWRVASLIISVIPCILAIPFPPVIFCLYVVWKDCPSGQYTIGRSCAIIIARKMAAVFCLMTNIFPTIYLLARAILLVESFISLRNLPDGAYAQVEWLRFLPHI